MTLLDVFRAHPATSGPLLDYHEAVMRGPSAFTVAERELMAAYVSALNACGYCLGVHRVTAASLGVDEGTIEALLADVDTAEVDERLRPVLRYVARLTTAPSRMVPGDADAVLAAGWDERALHDAASVCGLFNLMNRLVDGLGISAEDAYLDLSGRRLADGGYAALKDLF